MAITRIKTGIKTDLVNDPGGLMSWGGNTYGQLGLGSTNNSTSPSKISTVQQWSDISNSSSATFAIKTDGSLWVWGANDTGSGANFGILGLGSSTFLYYSSPVQIGSLTTWKQVSCGLYTTFAIKTDGTLWGWGQNTIGVSNVWGMLGNGTTVNYSSPIQIGTGTNWKQVSAAQGFTTAIKTDGSLWIWGINNYGQLGNGTTVYYSSPIQVGSLTNWSQVSSRSSGIAAIKTDGTLWTWGANNFGESALGVPTTVKYSSPVQVGSLTTWSQVSSSGSHILALKTDGTLWTCGYNATYGMLGNGSLVNYSSPIQIGTGTNWKLVEAAAGGTESFAIKNDGTLWAWGSNGQGQLGNGTSGTVKYSSPIQIGPLTTWKKISSGGSTATFGIADPQKTDLYGGLWISGSNTNGTLGDSTTVNGINQARTIPQSDSIISFSVKDVGHYIKSNGTLWAWGKNQYGEMGNDSAVRYSSPVQIGALTNWSKVSNYRNSAGAIKTDGTLWTWGQNNYGQLGNGTSINYSSPIQIGSLTNWSQVACGYQHTAAVKIDGTLWTWGRNFLGSIGNSESATVNYSSPIQIGLLTNWQQVSASGSHTAAVKTDGSLWTWGRGDYGQLGNNDSASYSSPIQVGSLTNWKQISIGYYNSYALKTDGTLWTWGYNNLGSLGNGTTINYSSPIQVGSLSNWTMIDGYITVLAIKTDSTLWGWGRGSNGELGNGATINYSSPIQLGSINNWKSISTGPFAVTAYHGVEYSQDVGDRFVDRGYILDTYTNVQVPGRKTPGVWMWGNNVSGELGIGSTTIVNYSSPVKVGSLTNWKQISSGNSYTYAIKTDGTFWAWGDNGAGGSTYGQIPVGSTGTNFSSPIQIGTATDWKESFSGWLGGHATKTNGTLWAWGRNQYGQLGVGDETWRSSPTQVGSLTNWKQVAHGYAYSTGAIKIDGTVWTWGEGASGQLGNSAIVNYSSPIQVGALTNWKWLAGGGQSAFYLAIKTDGTLWGWGSNTQGKLGNGTTIDYSSPIQIGSLTNWKDVHASGNAVAAIKTDGTLWVWGENGSGQLAIGTTVKYSSPVQVGSLTNWKTVKGAYNSAYFIALKTDGTLWGWGVGTAGQLGNGSLSSYSSPIQIGAANNWKLIGRMGGAFSGAIADGYF